MLKTGKGRFNKFKDNHVKMAKLLAAHSKKRKEGSSLTVIGLHRDLSRSPSRDSVDAMNLPAIEMGKAGLLPVTLNI